MDRDAAAEQVDELLDRGEADANRDGVITIRELDDFAAPKVSNYVLQRFAKSQTPQFKSDLQRRDAALFRR